MLVRTLDDISEDIRRKRKEMVILAKTHGFTHDQTVEASQDLDKLIYEYQTFAYKKEGRKRFLAYVPETFRRILKVSVL
ncbi:MAG: Spo0E family sporulation regulatory protein-aspartic acid phosphatase [Bacillus sp. (in: firmicutes)]